MTDIATVFIDFTKGADLALDGLILAEDDGLLTAVLISLFSDRQARADDVLPNADQGDTARRGWWADEFNADKSDRIGSHLWLNESAKQLPDVLVRDKQYAQAALQWLVNDGIASAVDVRAFSPRSGIRALAIGIHRANQAAARYQFEQFWRNA
jgi:phage gp46-like protein